MTRLVFVHSPFVGASAWEFVAEAMADQGWQTLATSLLPAFEGQPPYMSRLGAEVWSGWPAEASEPAVLIAHSGAGGLMPAAIAAAPAPVDAVILVDALVPQPGQSWRDGAPAELTERLDAFTDCGLLPEWNRWFSAKLLRQILPDDDMCEAFIEELPRVPASYLDEVVLHVDGWPPASGAYLQFSDAYAEEARKAAALGWQVASLPSDHLAMLTLPEDVAGAIESLLEALNIQQ